MSQGPPADLKTIGRAAFRAVNIIGERSAPAILICMVRRCVGMHRCARASVCVCVCGCVRVCVCAWARAWARVRASVCVCVRA